MLNPRFIARCFGLVLMALPVTATSLRAAPAARSGETELGAERDRLRTQLGAVNAEIAALKQQARRGVGDDYRLRARLADAEALARRLIDIEARLGLRAPVGRPSPLPVAAPTDGPADLEAKADILADQSRRVRLEADALGQRVAGIKGRQDLRRRAADLDRDPFAPLEGSKRRIATIASPAGATASGGAKDTTGNVQPPAPLPGGGAASTTGAGAANGAPSLGPGVSQTASSSTSPSPTVPTSITTAAGTPSSLSVEVRDLLDPATVAEIGRLESAKTPNGSVQALERAAAALHARADALDAAARAMRTSAHAPR